MLMIIDDLVRSDRIREINNISIKNNGQLNWIQQIVEHQMVALQIKHIFVSFFFEGGGAFQFSVKWRIEDDTELKHAEAGG